MKRITLLFSIAATALVFGACNQHSWDEESDAGIPTKKIFEPHGHGHDDHDGNHEKHDGEEKH